MNGREMSWLFWPWTAADAPQLAITGWAIGTAAGVLWLRGRAR